LHHGMGCAPSASSGLEEPSQQPPPRLPAPIEASWRVVRVDGLESRPDLNGKLGFVEGHIPESGRIKVRVLRQRNDRIEGDELIALRTANLRMITETSLLPGMCVVIRGLQHTPQYNGWKAIVESVLDESGRQLVRLEDGKQLAIRPDNLTVSTEEDTLSSLPAIMPTGGSEGTTDANGALGGTYSSAGHRNDTRERQAAMRSATWGRSFNSRQSLAELASIQNQLQALQARARAIDEELLTAAAASPASIPTGVQTRIAVLHGETQKLLETRVDAVLTSTLESGREKAKWQKRELTAQATELIEKLLELKQRLSSLESEVLVVAANVLPAETPAVLADGVILAEVGHSPRQVPPTCTSASDLAGEYQRATVVIGEWVD